MLNPESLIFEGEYEVSFKEENKTEAFTQIYDTLVNHMRVYQYWLNPTTNDLFSNKRSFVMEFNYTAHNKEADMPIKGKIYQFMGKEYKALALMSEKWLKNRRIDLPYEITIQIKILANRFDIKVKSQPIAYLRIARGGLRARDINEEQYQIIKISNQDFIKILMSTIHATEIKEPKARIVNLKFRLSNKLNNIDLKNIAELLDRGYTRINDGKIDNGLSDLRAALEKILVEFVKLIGGKPAEQQKVRENIDILYAKGYLDNNLKQLVKNVLVNYLYDYLSGKPTHERDKSELLNEVEANYLFSIFEDTLELLLSKIQRRI